MSLEFKLHPDKKLFKKTKAVYGPIAFELIEEMKKIMIERRGCGLAANQVGLDESFFIAKFSDGFEVCINPVIVQHGKEEVDMMEGCLSILGKDNLPIFKPKRRWAIVDLEYENQEGKNVRRTFKRHDARIVQHEMNHLEGILCQ